MDTRQLDEKMLVNRRSHRSVSVGNSVHIVGGYTPNGFDGNRESYTEKWILGEDGSFEIQHFYHAVGYDFYDPVVFLVDNYFCE